MGNTVIAVIGVLVCSTVLHYLSLHLIVKLMGDMMTRLIAANAVGGPPLGSINQQEIPAMGLGPRGITTEDPVLPPLEASIQRMATYLEQQYREAGHPIGRDEAVAQSRIMMADSGVMG